MTVDVSKSFSRRFIIKSRPYSLKNFLLVLSAGAVRNSANLFYILFPYAIYNMIIPHHNLRELTIWTLGLISAGALSVIAQHASRHLTTALCNDLSRTIRVHLFSVHSCMVMGPVVTRAKFAYDFVASPAFVTIQDLPWTLPVCIFLVDIEPYPGIIVMVLAFASAGLRRLSDADGHTGSNVRRTNQLKPSHGINLQLSRLVYDIVANTRSALVLSGCCALAIYGITSFHHLLVVVLSARKIFIDFDRMPGMLRELEFLWNRRAEMKRSMVNTDIKHNFVDLPLIFRNDVVLGLSRSADIILSKDVPTSLVIIGASGSGKTHMAKSLRVAAREALLHPAAGLFYCINHLDITPGLGYLPQRLPPLLGTVEEHIDYLRRSSSTGDSGMFENTFQRLRARYGTNNYTTTPRGVRRSICILHILVANPQVAILDEPVDDLDIEGMELLSYFLKYRKMNHKTTIIFTKHDINAQISCRLNLISQPIGYCCDINNISLFSKIALTDHA